jgi:beta-glucanase (GH16 family)
MYLLADLAVGGDEPGPPGVTTQFPASLDIDYVRVWQRG